MLERRIAAGWASAFRVAEGMVNGGVWVSTVDMVEK